MNDAAFGQFVDHGYDLRQAFLGGSGFAEDFEFTDGVAGGFPVVAVALVALSALAYVFFGCFVISHK